MSDGLPTNSRPDVPEEFSGRPDRIALLGFAVDATTETALREGLGGALRAEPEIRRGDIRQAIVALQHSPAPSTLIVDVAGETQPLAMLEDLAQVVEPDVTVLVIGDRQDMGFYRQITRGLGVREYLFKPLTTEMVARHFGTMLGGRDDTSGVLRGGRVLAVLGARPGVGASTLACNLAWYLGALENRHTVLVDPNLHTGTVALMLGVQPSPALRSALENPGRIDELYVERAVQPAGPRLDVLASECSLEDTLEYVGGAAGRLLDMLQRRYNFIVLDAPVDNTPLLRDLRERTHQSVVVFDPTLPAIRDTLRLLSMTRPRQQVTQPLLVLNRAGAPGGLSTAQVKEALQVAPDLTIADVGRRAREAELTGQPSIALRGPMREAVAQMALRIAGVRPVAPRRRLLARLFR